MKMKTAVQIAMAMTMLGSIPAKADPVGDVFKGVFIAAEAGLKAGAIAALVAVGSTTTVSGLGSYVLQQSLSKEAKAQGIAQVHKLEQVLGTKKTQDIAIAMAAGMDPESDAFKALDQAGELGKDTKDAYKNIYESYLLSSAK